MRHNRSDYEEVRRRFWSYVEKTESCWLWRGGRSKSGYGNFRVSADEPNVSTHRFAYEDTIGPIPRGKLIRHSCDVKICVRPDHLAPGTVLENSQDAMVRHRQARGFRLPQTKLSEEDVARIRAEYGAGGISQRQLGRKYGVSQGLINHILCGRSTHGKRGFHAA